MKKAVKNQDFVFHFGGLSGINESLEKPLETAKTNILSTLKLLELSRQFKLKRFVYASSVYVNSDQGGFYKSSKKAAEDYIEEYYKRYKLNFTILRFGTIYGTRANKENTINNIIDNAIKYGQKINVELSKKGKNLFIVIEDDGPGIPPEEYNNVFKPFYKINKGRSETKSSVGLGLAIASDITRSHGGYIRLNKSSLNGLEVKIFLPA